MKFLALSLSDVVFIMLINVKMPTIVGIWTLKSRINLFSAELSMKKSFITSKLDSLWLRYLDRPGIECVFYIET